MSLFLIVLFQSKSLGKSLGKSSVRFALATVIACCLLLSSVASLFAHPLGNFTINRYTRLEIGRLEIGTAQIDLIYVINMAEIPTHRMRTQIDSDGNDSISEAEEEQYLADQKLALAANLVLTVEGNPLVLRNQSIKLTFLEGQAGLPTMRIDALYRGEAALATNLAALDYQDQNFAGQLGWQEVVVEPLAGVSLVNSSAPSKDLSNELRNYPTDLLTNPPAVNSARIEISFSGGSRQADKGASTQTATADSVKGTTANGAGIGKPSDGFAELIKTEELTLMTILLALLAAFGWGAAHALSPGHGKTIVGAYLVGTRGTVGHALFLGLTTTITHTAGVFVLGLITLLLSNFILPETLYPWLGVLSGLMIVILGLSMSWTRLKAALGFQHAPEHTHDSALLHDHGDGHYHSHLPPTTAGAVSWRNLLALGVSGGLIPCPSALVLMLGAISLQRVGFGMLLIFIFSLGLASVLSAIGILLVRARRLFDRVPVDGSFARLLPVASALFITLVGLGITWQAFISIGVSIGVFVPQLTQIFQMF